MNSLSQAEDKNEDGVRPLEYSSETREFLEYYVERQILGTDSFTNINSDEKTRKHGSARFAFLEQGRTTRVLGLKRPTPAEKCETARLWLCFL